MSNILSLEELRQLNTDTLLYTIPSPENARILQLCETAIEYHRRWQEIQYPYPVCNRKTKKQLKAIAEIVRKAMS